MSLLTKTRPGTRLGILGEVAELALGTGGALGLRDIRIGGGREPVKMTEKLGKLGQRERGVVSTGGRLAEREDRPAAAVANTITLTLTRDEAEIVYRALGGTL